MTRESLLASWNTSDASLPSTLTASNIFTPPSEDSSQLNDRSTRPISRRPSPLKVHLRQSRTEISHTRDEIETDGEVDLAFGVGSDTDEENNMAERPPLHRPTDGRSQLPLLKDERGRPSYDSPNGSARPAFVARRSTFRSRSPDFDAQTATRRRYTYAAFFLLLSLVSFVIQTETAVYIQRDLKWNKAYCMLYGQATLDKSRHR